MLMPIYCLSGCDTTSSFHGHGKRTAFRIMLRMAKKLQELSTLGSGPLNESERAACVRFVGMIYGASDIRSLNNLRAEKAQGKVQPRKLPPTDDSLVLHLQHFVYQLMIWLQAGTAKHKLPDPTEFGYERDSSNTLRPRMMTQPSAPPKLLQDLVCSCEPNMCHEGCTCNKNQQACTAECSCKAELPLLDNEYVCCTNPETVNALTNDMSESDSDSD